ncbi:helix-turn-helix domain-containing protein [Dysgonomonas massiliensis]|uniref:helix-turn-helix domain-containing protein n=1 Tax=Dysgonomonas massiliensis TaxID=2040292 RepID=UPI000C7846E4|nr:helix-turn-helix transcriptional regulator [Dysgonomonas massiliensis]
MSVIGKNIKKIRNVKGLSQQAFADLFQLTRGNISSYEELRAEPKIEVLIKIANYFGIPLTDFVEKDLSVNELLHYNTRLVFDTERLKVGQQMVNIPFVPAIYIGDLVQKYEDNDFLSSLPSITVPSNSRLKLLAIEIDNPESLPAGLDLRSGDVVILENVVEENYHRIDGKFGMMINREALKFGVFRETDAKIYLSLNEMVKYPFDFNSATQYWFLKATYKQDL